MENNFGDTMDEDLLKIYDNLYNVIGVATRSKVHAEGLLHQVVHLWMLEVRNGEKWLYFRKRSEKRAQLPGCYDLIASGHCDPEETFEDAITDAVHTRLGIKLSRKNLKHVGNHRQIVDRGDYHDNAFCQVYLCTVEKPKFVLKEVPDVIQIRYDDFKSWVIGLTDSVPIYSRTGEKMGSSTKDKWWLREKEFLAIVSPYIEKNFPTDI